jgi:Domain of unknown function (DUF4159)
MKVLPIIVITGLLSAASLGVLAMAQRNYEGEEEGPDLPVDIHEQAEWAFARFHFPGGNNGFGGYRGFQIWAADYPKADRQFVRGLRRLTRLNARAMEQVVDANSDKLFDWPWIYMEHGNNWNLNQEQAALLRAYLLKGGFLFSDDTHGDYEWDGLMQGLHMIFPDRAVEELKDSDEIFHVVYDLDNRFKIHGTRFLWGGRPYSPDMVTPRWRAIRDDDGRIMVVICHNSDVGDAWEWADSPHYPENETSLAYRIGINYILYDLTH